MTRSTPDWTGKTDDTPAPKRVRLRVFEAHGGKCAICERKIVAGEPWELDHTTALINGGKNVESNLQPLHRACHRGKTNADVAMKSKDRRVRTKHLGIHKPKTTMDGSKSSKWKKRMDGTAVRRD